MRKNHIVIGLVCLLVAESLATGMLPYTKGLLYDAFQTKEGIYFCILLAFANYFMVDLFQSFKNFVVIKVSTVYRAIRTTKVVKGKLADVPSASQRIQEDIKLSYHSHITVWCEYFISAIIVIQLMIINVSQPILVGASVAYAAISVVIAYLFNPKLTLAEKDVQQKEADFRTNLNSVIGVDGLSHAIKANLKAATIRLQYQLFTKLQLGLLNVLPYIVLTPLLVNGTITLGELVKHQVTFSLIVVNAAILIQYYTVLIQGKASESRVRELEK